ncbi:Ran-binding protein [Entamoeba marina]
MRPALNPQSMNLRELEEFAYQTYNNPTIELVPFSFPQCQLVLSESTHDFAIIHSAKSLSQAFLICDPKDRPIMKNLVYSFIKNRAMNFQFGINSFIIKCFVQMIKVTWDDKTVNTEILNEFEKIVNSNLQSIPLIFTCLEMLNDTMSNTQHNINRQSTIDYRDNYLFQVFVLAYKSFNLITQNQQNPQIMQYIQYSISLLLSCLKYNFIGTNVDETTDDIHTVQLPTAYRAYFQDMTLVQTLFDLYFNFKTPVTNYILDCLAQIALIRKGLWNRDADYKQMVLLLLNGAHKITQTMHGMDNSETVFSFCRFLDRFKANHSIHESMSTFHVYSFSELSQKILTQWECHQNAVVYILSFWNKLVSATQLNSDTETEKLMNSISFTLAQTFVNSIFQFFEKCDYSDDASVIDNDEFKLQDYMESLSTLGRAQIKEMGMFVSERFEYLMSSLSQITSPQMYNTVARKKIETQIVWLMMVINCLLNRSSRHCPQSDSVQASLVVYVFKCMSITDSLVDYVNKTVENSVEVQLEIEYLVFFSRIKINYISGSQYNNDTVNALLEALGITKIEEVVFKIMTKIVFNLQKYPINTELIGKTLDSFLTFVSSCSQSKYIAELPVTKNLMIGHSSTVFEFLSKSTSDSQRTKLRRKLYSILGKLLFQEEKFDFVQFMRPFDTKIQYLIQSLGSFATDGANMVEMLLSVIIDLQGLFKVASTASQYLKLFEWFFFDYYEAVIFAGSNPQRMSSIFYNESTTKNAPLLLFNTIKLLKQFTDSTYNRINFPNSSPNAILMFRAVVDTLQMLCSLVQYMPQKFIQKSIPRIFTIFVNLINGTFIPYGVMIYYNDPALPKFMSCVTSSLCSFSDEQVLEDPKLRTTIFTTINGMFSVLYRFTFALDPATFQRILVLLLAGLKSTEIPIVRSSTKTIQTILDVYDSIQTRETEDFSTVVKQMSGCQQFFGEFLNAVFELILFCEFGNQLRAQACLVQLIKHFQQKFTDYKTKLFQSQPTNEQQQLVLDKFNLIENAIPEQNFQDTLNKCLTDLRNNISPIS